MSVFTEKPAPPEMCLGALDAGSVGEAARVCTGGSCWWHGFSGVQLRACPRIKRSEFAAAQAKRRERQFSRKSSRVVRVGSDKDPCTLDGVTPAARPEIA